MSNVPQEILDERQLRVAAVKLTYVGPQDKQIRSVLLRTPEFDPARMFDAFLRVQSRAEHYVNDAELEHVVDAKVTPAELAQVERNLRGVSKLAQSPRAVLVVTTLRASGTKDFAGEELRFALADAPRVYAAVTSALAPVSAEALAAVRRQEKNVGPRQ